MYETAVPGTLQILPPTLGLSPLTLAKELVVPGTAVSYITQMKTLGKQVFLSFRSYYPLYGYSPKGQRVYFYK